MLSTDKIGVVVIGRNEGARLRACLASLRDVEARLVYVDSGSSDGSVEAARAAGAEVLELDMSRPFTAARARNAGLARLIESGAPEHVQFLDGDCSLAPGWLQEASGFLDRTPQAVAVAGQLREKEPERSVYNRICDAEWDGPIGRVDACGGIAMMRVAPLQAAGGFREDLLAGEEPELCLRLRRAGGEIWRIDAEMAWHDADMTRFSQWWRRNRRAGFAYAQGRALHGAGPERYYVAETRRILFWAGLLPLVVLALALVGGPWARYALVLYPLQVFRLSQRFGLERSFFVTLGKFAEMQGMVDFWRQRRTGKTAAIPRYEK